LQRKDGGRVADVAIGNRRLDRQDSHPTIIVVTVTPVPTTPALTCPFDGLVAGGR